VTERADVLLVCNSGGHLAQLVALREAWEPFRRCWVVPDTSDARSLLAHERVAHASHPTTRNLPNLIRNLRLAVRVLYVERPSVVVTTGAGVAVPFAWLARAFGAKVVWIESFTRVHQPSLSCRLVAPIASRTYVQWPELVTRVARSRYVGSVFADP
jgi:beta-1,4-N-acetylglucosaminyltransferase